jgi:tRNA (guanosine-2'-O-)-methyltransferase
MFPFQTKISVGFRAGVDHQLVNEHVWPLLTPERQLRISQVVTQRCFSIVPVLEDLFDRGNLSACLRSAEAAGLGQVHVIEKGLKFKESQRTTAGADKWVEVKKWKTTESCVTELKAQGFQIIATCLSEKSKPISIIDFSKPTAVVLGSEKSGISLEMKALADELVILPMYGFVQSYNISVAAALCFYQARQAFEASLHKSSELSEVEQSILRAVYAGRTLDSAEEIIKRWMP